MKRRPSRNTTLSAAARQLQNPPGSNPSPRQDDLVLKLVKDVQFVPGCGFGITQSILRSAIDVKIPPGFVLAKIETAMEEFVLAPIKGVASGENLETQLVSRIHTWQAAIQLDSKVPVFGRYKILGRSKDTVKNGATTIDFVLPSYSKALSIKALQFVIEAINALAPNAESADMALPWLRERYQVLVRLMERYAVVGSNAIHFIEAAHLLDIERNPVVGKMWAFGLGSSRSYFNSSLTGATPVLGVALSKDKLQCSQLLAAAGLPVARNALAPSADAAVKLAQQIGYPVVIKPVDAEKGLGVTAGIINESDLRKAFAAAVKISARVMIEKHQQGRDYRVTVLHGQAVKVMDRRPGGVIGDGLRTIADLVAARRAEDNKNRLYMRKKRPPLVIDEEAIFQLEAQGLDPSSVVSAGTFVPLRRRANISGGGTYDILAPDEIHPDNRQLAENAAIALGLDIAGIDIISADPKLSWRKTGGIICEVNAQPQIGYRDSEKLFGEILTTVLGGKGYIPVHLLLLQNGLALSRPLPELAQREQCNAAVWGTSGWIAGGGTFGPFANVFLAAKGVLLDKRVTGALVAMTEPEVLRFGLPLARFASIRLIGETGWAPMPATQLLVKGHAEKILVSKTAVTRQETIA